MLVFAVMMLVGLAITKFVRYESIYKVERQTNGSLYYGLIIAFLALLWLPESPDLFRYGILILTIPDALAALVGSQWGRQIPGWNKSRAGSVTFFVATVCITIIFTLNPVYILILALTLTAVEFVSQWGLDNLFLPIVGSGLLMYLV